MNNSEILIYQSPEGTIKIDVRLEDETVWLTQAQMGQLFGKGRTTITEHIRNIFVESELLNMALLKENCRKLRHSITILMLLFPWVTASNRNKTHDSVNGRHNI
jgi:hypothetical protein